MKKTLLTAISFSILVMSLTGCKNEVKMPESSEICGAVNSGEFSEAETVINQYLSSQKPSLSEEQKLEELKNWLQSMTCVSAAEITCKSCIYTFPAQSEIRLSFIVNDQLVEQTLDISMENPLKFRSFHE